MQIVPNFQNNKYWKTIHCSLFTITGSFYLIASLLLFPIISSFFDSYTQALHILLAGSICWVLMNIIELLYYCKTKVCSKIVAFLTFLSLISTFLFLAAAIIYQPIIDQQDLRQNIFLIASITMIITKALKVALVLYKRQLSRQQNWIKNRPQYLIQFFTIISILFYTIGTVLYQQSTYHPQIIVQAVAFYSFGGLLLLTSALYTIQLYFYSSDVGELLKDPISDTI